MNACCVLSVQIVTMQLKEFFVDGNNDAEDDGNHHVNIADSRRSKNKQGR